MQEKPACTGGSGPAAQQDPSDQDFLTDQGPQGIPRKKAWRSCPEKCGKKGAGIKREEPRLEKQRAGQKKHAEENKKKRLAKERKRESMTG